MTQIIPYDLKLRRQYHQPLATNRITLLCGERQGFTAHTRMPLLFDLPVGPVLHTLYWPIYDILMEAWFVDRALGVLLVAAFKVTDG